MIITIYVMSAKMNILICILINNKYQDMISTVKQIRYVNETIK